MKKIFILLILICPAIYLFADSPFAVIMYDTKTEQELGVFPPSRAQYSVIIDTLTSCDVKAIVLKYFLDLPKDANGDLLLSKSLKKVPVFLQASIDNTETNPNPLPAIFSIKDNIINFNLISGTSGWIPLKIFSDNAFAIGFVDIRSPARIPLFVKYQNNYFPSLWYSILKYSLPDIRIAGNKIINGRNSLPIDSNGDVKVEYPEDINFQYYSFIDVIQNRIPQKSLQNKTVIIGYDGDKIDSFTTNTGNIKSHRAFFYSLNYIYNLLK